MNAWAVLVAAGLGKRFGGKDHKPFIKVGGHPLAWYSLSVLWRHPAIRGVVWVVHPSDWEEADRIAQRFTKKPVMIVTGGARRQDSVLMGLRLLPKTAKWVAVHDAARPLLTLDLLSTVLAGARARGAAILALPVSDTVKRENSRGDILKTVPRRGLWLAQTPQVFRTDLLRKAFDRHGKQGVTDDALLMERMNKPVKLVPGSPWNIKVTTRSDLPIVEALLKTVKKSEGK